MPNLSSKIAVPIILAGVFIITVFAALNYTNLDKNFYIVFSAVVIYIFLFGFATGQNFVQPVKRIIEKADELAKGNLSSRVYLENKDELGRLAVILNELGEKLEESKAAIEAAERGVDIKVKARTEVLEETITALEQKVKNRTLELERIQKELEILKNKTKNARAS